MPSKLFTDDERKNLFAVLKPATVDEIKKMNDINLTVSTSVENWEDISSGDPYPLFWDSKAETKTKLDVTKFKRLKKTINTVNQP